MPEDTFNFISALSDRGRHKLHGVIDLAKRTIHDLLIQLTHATGRFNYLSNLVDRSKRNVEIMLQFEIYGIMEESPLNAIAQQCEKIQQVGFSQWTKDTDQPMQDLVKNFRIKALQDIRPTVDPLKCMVHFFGSDGLGIHYNSSMGQSKFANLIAIAESAGTYGTVYPNTTTVCWNANQVREDLTPNQVMDSVLWQLDNLTQTVRKMVTFKVRLLSILLPINLLRLPVTPTLYRNSWS